MVRMEQPVSQASRANPAEEGGTAGGGGPGCEYIYTDTSYTAASRHTAVVAPVASAGLELDSIQDSLYALLMLVL